MNKEQTRIVPVALSDRFVESTVKLLEDFYKALLSPEDRPFPRANECMVCLDYIVHVTDAAFKFCADIGCEEEDRFGQLLQHLIDEYSEITHLRHVFAAYDVEVHSGKDLIRPRLEISSRLISCLKPCHCEVMIRLSPISTSLFAIARTVRTIIHG